MNAAMEKRGSKAVLKDYNRLMDTVRSSETMRKQWENYQKDFEYATDIAFEETCDVVVQLMDSIMISVN